MADYEYNRVIDINNNYKVNNPDRLDGELKQIDLAKEVETAIPGKEFIMRCNENKCTFIFDNDLLVEDKTKLDDCVNNHQNNL